MTNSIWPAGRVRGPFKALLQAPELGDLVQAVGGHLRYEGALPGDLRELAILVTGRHASAQYEFLHTRRSELMKAWIKTLSKL